MTQSPWTPERIRAIADALELSPTELAVECGVTESTARRWLAGATTPNDHQAIMGLERLERRAIRAAQKEKTP